MRHTDARFKCWRAAAMLLLIGAGTIDVASADQGFELRTISSRPDTVSGGDVLVQLSAPKQSHWSAQLNGVDVTTSFRPTEEPVALVALLSGLKLGENLLTIQVNGS